MLSIFLFRAAVFSNAYAKICAKQAKKTTNICIKKAWIREANYNCDDGLKWSCSISGWKKRNDARSRARKRSMVQAITLNGAMVILL